MITLTKITDTEIVGGQFAPATEESAFLRMIKVNRKIALRPTMDLLPIMPLTGHREGLGANDLLSLQSAFRIIAVHGGTVTVSDDNPWTEYM